MDYIDRKYYNHWHRAKLLQNRIFLHTFVSRQIVQTHFPDPRDDEWYHSRPFRQTEWYWDDFGEYLFQNGILRLSNTFFSTMLKWDPAPIFNYLKPQVFKPIWRNTTRAGVIILNNDIAPALSVVFISIYTPTILLAKLLAILYDLYTAISVTLTYSQYGG